MVDIESHFDDKKQTIALWLDDQKKDIRKNQELISHNSEENNVKILLVFVQNMLIRAMNGDRGSPILSELQMRIQKISDLTEDNYRIIIENSKYRWGVETGVSVVSNIVKYFGQTLNWNWTHYLSLADKNRKTNFLNDDILKIKYIKYKLRDLALSNFNPYYAAFDLHVTRVTTRLGLLNYGFDLLTDKNVEMGNNPANKENYLFMHKLFMKLSELTNEKYLAVDFDRIFWHFGRTICGATPKCNRCPVKSSCLTGRYSA